MTDSNTFLKKLDDIDDLPTLPSIVLEVDKLLQDYNTPMETLIQTIEKDQAMVPKLLKLVNSAFFGLQSKVSEISRAVSFLGFNTVRNAIVSISVVEAFKPNGKSGCFDIKDFWTHSIAVAVTSKCLSYNTNFKASETAFTGGLLHDIGKVILALYFNDVFNNVWTLAEDNKMSFYDAEKKESSTTHAQIGAYLAKKWHLPSDLVYIIQNHHEVTETSKVFDLLAIIHTADVIVNRYEIDTEKKIGLSKLCPDVASPMRDQLESAPDWFPNVSEDIQSACELFLGG